MKRSEMLNMISRTLEDINIENYYDEKGSEWCANLILMEIEEKGMLPPHDGNGRVIFEDVQYIIDHYNWEPEDV